MVLNHLLRQALVARHGANAAGTDGVGTTATFRARFQSHPPYSWSDQGKPDAGAGVVRGLEVMSGACRRAGRSEVRESSCRYRVGR